MQSAYEIDEGRYFTAEFSASDPEGGAVSVTLSGDDSSFFRLDAGSIVANASFDFDAPQDADGDSIYELSLEASDGVQSVVQDFSVSVLDIPRDGVVRILNAQNLVSAGDFDGDGLDELLVRPIREPGVVLTVAGILLPGQAMVAESSTSFDATAPASDAGAIEGRVTFRMDYDVGAPFNPPLVGGTYMSATGARKYAGMVAANLKTGDWLPADATMLFPDTFDVRNSGPDINLSIDALPAGLRSTRDPAIGVLGAFLPVGDMDGDGYSEVIQDRHTQIPGPFGSVEQFTLMSGKTIRDGSSGGLFATVSDVTAQVLTITHGTARYNASGSAYDQWPYREPGTADVDSDGFDDFIEIVGLRGSAPYDPYTDTPVEGYEISVYSGRRLMDRPNGKFAAESFSAPDVFRIITTDEIGTPNIAGIGDVDGDGFADILIRMFNGGFGNDHDRFEAYLVSGAALTSAADGTITIGLETVPGVTGFNMSLFAGGVDDAFITSDIIGDEGSDVVLSLHYLSPTDKTTTATAIVLSGQLFAGGFPARIDLTGGPYSPPDAVLADLPDGSFVRIDSPPFQGTVVEGASGDTFYGYGAFSSWGGSTSTGGISIGDIDGDDRQELALVYFTDDQMYGIDPTKPEIRTTDVFILNSRVLESARLAGESINLGASFD
ncbi:MAG: cadherin repeat domain-containing protein [Alphaproteobacteria bacterium]|nr:cadherin repeat domain-containing protein [Alphaproteobacteria bacterium]MBU2083530.1 cadherin repeat domain-containing protein [Alphaproteobacteria bacterium]MBU2143175.1 cadherin repeat domain-containing protein [Alphaproteobacteria bacterium]MBU2195887.1 cadherin repeat domain-containing protein [Alphaproteobacteria bacterium]